MRVQDVMTTRVLTIDASDSVDHARGKMREAGVHQLVVCGKRGRVIGVIGAADVKGAPDGQRRSGLHVAHAADRPTGYRAGKCSRADARESHRLVAGAGRVRGSSASSPRRTCWMWSTTWTECSTSRSAVSAGDEKGRLQRGVVENRESKP